MSRVTEQLAKFLRRTRYEDIPPDCVQTAKLCVLDFLGVSLLGAKEPAATILNDFLSRGGGPPESTILYYGRKSSAMSAALANGTFGHALDFDDDSSTGAGHLTTCIAPALLALAEKLGRGGREILLCFVLAYEVGSILARTLEPEETQRGWHATSTIGTFAATAGAAKLLRLGENQIAQAFGIAATQTSGLRRNFGTMCKPFHAGKAAQKAVESSLLAQMGFSADEEIFDGKWGIFEVFSGRSPQFERLGFRIRENWFKPYPSCGCTHSALDAAISLRGRSQIDPRRIERVEVGVLPIAFDTLLFDHPRTPYEAKFSMPFCVSLALLQGEVLVDHFSLETMKDPLLNRLMKKVVMEADPGLAGGGYRGTYGASLRIRMSGGETLEEKVLAPRGHPRNPLSTEALLAKFRGCAQPLLSARRVHTVSDMIMNLEKMRNVRALMRSLKGARRK